MTYYYEKKPLAEEAAAQLLAAHPDRIASTKCELEPYNGWVVVLVPKFQDLSDLAEVAEIRDGQRRPAPAGRKRPTPLEIGPTSRAKASDGELPPAFPERGRRAASGK